ncbi:hypothetical protein BJ170DRAFT_684660 [Xylariales sp. AK1849]|nr:hypothetical protein BJ170DRAFT_684660 [Xylariales sp. AK1849]
MDDPGWSWPAWKFGMKRDELFTKLHDQYNTFPSSIQDPEAFHHDVYEISNTASTTDEFHRFLADRKALRLRELNESLESASLEIIANPKLIGTEQWQYALQLFRTKSLDSLVRYFASYLSGDHPWQHAQDDARTSTTASSISDSLTDSDDSVSTNSSEPFFDDEDHHHFLTHEPLIIHSSISASRLPPSPRSLTICTDSSDIAHHDYAFGTLTPARTLSFSENDSDVMVRSGMLSHRDEEDELSQFDELDTPVTSISDISEVQADGGEPTATHHDKNGYDESITLKPVDSVESETPPPRAKFSSGSDMSTKPTKCTKQTESIHRPSSPLYTQVLHEYVRSRKSRRDDSPGWSVRRTSPEVGRVHKPLPDPVRVRPKGRRRND